MNYQQFHSVFKDEGVVRLSNVFSATDLEQLSQGIDQAMASKGRYTRIQSDPDDPGLFFSDYWASDRVNILKSFIADSVAAETAARIMNSNLARFFFDAIWVKEPGTEKKSTWHQDQPYYCVEGNDICIMWIPIDPVSSSVSLRCVKKSHTLGKSFAPIRFTDESGFGRGDRHGAEAGYEVMPDIENDQRFEILSWDLEPGDCLVFHGMTIHGAPGNNGVNRRRAVSLTWLGDDVRYVARPGEMEPHRPEFDSLQNGDPLPEKYFPTIWNNPDPAL